MILSAYAAWIADSDGQGARLWRNAVEQGGEHREGAWSEAIAWDWLRTQGNVTRGVGGGGKNPDFHVSGPHGNFVVEVTNISTDVMTETTQIPAITGRRGAQVYRSPAPRICREVIDKAAQGRGLTCPFVVLVSCFHPFGSALMLDDHLVYELLRGPEYLQMEFDANLGRGVGEVQNVTGFEKTAFLKNEECTAARRNVSAVVLGPWAYDEQGRHPLLGLMHPEAVRPLDHTLLPHARLAYFAEWPVGGSVKIAWHPHSQDGKRT